jgi:hypothetical protein
MRSAIHKSERATSEQSEMARERAVGEPLYAQTPPELESTLRPQQGRNVVWRWHMRRKTRAE